MHSKLPLAVLQNGQDIIFENGIFEVRENEVI
jgi:hypothetical protein